MQIKQLRKLVDEDLKAVDTFICQQLQSNIPLIEKIGEHIINSGGKRLRPLLVLLSARAHAYEGDEHIQLAAIIEFIHTATLLHDDVVDGSLLRRGIDTAHTIWGSSASVLVGDFIYSRSFQMMVALNKLSIMHLLANTTNTIAEGEVLQLLHKNKPDTSEQHYMQVIRCKTAILFSAAAKLGALIATDNEQIIETMENFGMHLGMAFQLVDDALDYQSTKEEMGKNMGDDLAEGKATLPLIHALYHGNARQKEIIQQALHHGSLDDIAEIARAIAQTKAIDYTYRRANEHIDKAITCLVQATSDSDYRQNLIELCKFAVERKY